MPDLAPLAAFLGGLGLFLTGVAGLSAATRRLAGPRLRALVARGVSSVPRAVLAGLGAGLVTQSTMAVTAAAGGLVAAGAMPLRSALPLLSWTNIGTTGVALLATLDIRTAALLLVGIGAALPFFRLDLRGRLGPVLALLLALGMQLLGASLMKAGLAPLAQDAALAAFLDGPAAAVAPFLLGTAIAFAAASGSAANVLAIVLGVAGVLDLPHAASLIYGGCAGSGLAQWVAGIGGDADGRRAALYQAAWKILGTGLVTLLLVAEGAGAPGLLALCRALADGIAGQLAILMILFQAVIALAALPLDGFAAGWLRRRVPDPPEADLARPRYLSAASLRDPATALDLAARETGRLLDRLPLALDGVREEATAPPPGLSPATAKLEAAIQAHLAALQEGSPEAVDAAASLRDRVATATALREAAEEVAAAAAAVTGPASASLSALIEALHALLQDAADPDIALLDDRTDAMDALRRRVAPGLPPEEHRALFRATDAFARAVWLMRRLAVRAG